MYELFDPERGTRLLFWQSENPYLFSVQSVDKNERYLTFGFDDGATGTGEYASIGVPPNKEVRVPVEVARQMWRLLTVYSPEEKSWSRTDA